MELRKLKASISESLKTLDKNKVLASFRKQVSSCKPIRKDIQVAERAKAEGNRLYADIRNHDTPLNYNVLHLYNKSIAYAPVGSEELASAYSNKSALLKSMRKYSECITEIDQGIKISQSVPLKIKLLCRKSECLTALGLCENTRCLEKAKFFLSKLENTEEKLKKMLSKLIAKTQRVVDEGKLDTPKKNRRKMEASIELAKAENHSVWSSVQLEFSEKFGRNLAAKRDFEPGQILFVEKPYSSCLSDSRIHMYCSLCFEYLYTIVACEHCPWRSYCSEKCKDEAWNEYHKMECSVLCNMKTSSLPESDISYLACFLISIFFKALKEAGSLRQMQDEVESIDDSSDVMSKGFTSNGEFSSYKSLYSLPIRNHDEDSYQLSLMCALTSLMGIAKYSQVFGSTYDVHEMKKLKKNDDAIFVGALLLKFSLDIGDCTANANLADPSNDEILSREEMFESYRNSMAELDEIPTDSSVALTSMLIIRGCVPNVQICATFGNKYIVYALQPIKAGSQLSVDMYNSSIFDLSPKSRRQEKHQILYKCPCDCEACTDDWSEILGDLLRGVPDVLARDSMIAHKVVPEVNSVVREWKENAHKQNYPTIKQVTKIRSAVLNAYKHASMPSQVIIHAVGFMRVMFLAFFNPSEMNSKNTGLQLKGLFLAE